MNFILGLISFTNRFVRGCAPPTRVSPIFTRLQTGRSPSRVGYLSTDSIGLQCRARCFTALQDAGSLGDGSLSPRPPAASLQNSILEGLGEAVWGIPFSKRFPHL